MLGFAIGMFVGTLFGAIIMALCAAAGQADKRQESDQKDH